MRMASPIRSISRLAIAAALAVSVVLQPAAASAQEGMSLIRDTEIGRASCRERVFVGV